MPPSSSYYHPFSLILFLSILLFEPVTSASPLLFTPSSLFASLQLKLSTTSGFIMQNGPTSFSFPNNGYYNLSSIGLALCGYDLPASKNMQWKAQASYDEGVDSFVIVVIPSNGTMFYYLNYYLLLCSQQARQYIYLQNQCLSPLFNTSSPSNYARYYTYTFPLPLPFSPNSPQITGLPFLTSLSSIAFPSYNYYNITQISYSPSTKQYKITVWIQYAKVEEVCITLMHYYEDRIENEIRSVNGSYGMGRRVRDQGMGEWGTTFQDVASAVFGMYSIYGARYSPKCVVGLQSLKLSSSLRQTLSFNLTNQSPYNLAISSHYSFQYTWFCLAQIHCPNPSHQYYPSINTCEPICTIQHCHICSTSTSCIICNDGYFINQLYRCDQCGVYCLRCDGVSSCSMCRDGYYWNGNTKICTVCNPFCLACTASSCSSCQPSYTPVGSQCKKCSVLMPLCITCSGTNYCSQCPQYTFFHSVTLGCQRCDTQNPGCQLCSSYTYCMVCAFGYYLQSGKCYTCVLGRDECCGYFISNCVKCTSTIVCKNCAMGYYLTLNSTTCTLCNSTLPNCLSCTSSSSCQLCPPTHLLLPSTLTCQQCSTLILHCLQCTSLTVCSLCQSPYMPINGSCYNCPVYPLQMKYYIDKNNNCVDCRGVTPFCVRCLGELQCVKCQQGYYIVAGGVCLPCSDAIQHCFSCYNVTNCAVCANGYYLNTTCQPCNTTLLHCLACTLLPSTLTTTLSCLVCSPQYFIQQHQCQPCNQQILFCLTCVNNYQCQQCTHSYYLSSTLTCISCNQLIQGCTICNSSSNCGQCQAGYYLINGYCSPCSIVLPSCYTCINVNSNMLQCLNCLPTHHLALNFTCMPCNYTLKYCQKCVNQRLCVECDSGYTVDYRGLCVECREMVPWCEYCEKERGCVKCLEGYLKDQVTGDCKACSQYQQGCSLCQYIQMPNTNTTSNLTTYTFLPNCTLCLPSYLLYLPPTNLTNCLSCPQSIPNCIQCLNLTHCLTCKNTSFLSIDKRQCLLCVLYVQNCVYCGDSSVCLGCREGYYLEGGKCGWCDLGVFGKGAMGQYTCAQCRNSTNAAVCIQCSRGYLLQQGQCFNCSQLIPSCLQCTTSTLCLTCHSSFYLSPNNTACLPCPSSLIHCLICNPNNTCQICQPYAYKTSQLKCVHCDQVLKNCGGCDNGQCFRCKDGYVMEGGECVECGRKWEGCVLCGSQGCTMRIAESNSNNQQEGTLTNQPTLVYIIIAAVSILVLLILLCCLCYHHRKHKKSQQSPPLKSSHSHYSAAPSHRELLPDNLMYSDQLSEIKTVKIPQKQVCHFCNQNNVQIMNVELLCGKCEKIEKRGKAHKIRQVVKRNPQKMLREEERDEEIVGNNQFAPPPSTIKQNEEKVQKEKTMTKKQSQPQNMIDLRGQEIGSLPAQSRKPSKQEQQFKPIDHIKKRRGLNLSNNKYSSEKQ